LLQDIWNYAKRKTLSKVSKSSKTGAEGCKLTPEDHLILDIMGRESSSLVGLGLDDSAPVFHQKLAKNNSILLENNQESFYFEGKQFSSLLNKFLKTCCPYSYVDSF